MKIGVSLSFLTASVLAAACGGSVTTGPGATDGEDQDGGGVSPGGPGSGFGGHAGGSMGNGGGIGGTGAGPAAAEAGYGGMAIGGGGLPDGGQAGGSATAGSTGIGGDPWATPTGPGNCPAEKVGFAPLTDFTSGIARVSSTVGHGTIVFMTDGSGAVWPPARTPDGGPANVPTELVPGCTMSALHVRGKDVQGFAVLSANLGYGFASVDLSAYTGVVISVAGAAPGLQLTIGTADTQPTQWGGTCDEAGPKPCYDGYGDFVDVDSIWRQVKLPFASLRQAGWGKPGPMPMDKSHVLGLGFPLPLNADFDLWVSAVGLY
jgi:hypothetical protein